MAADAVQQLKALKSDFDGLRSHLTCKICDRMLYQPYTIACGHTYCYTVRRRARSVFAPGTQQADHTRSVFAHGSSTSSRTSRSWHARTAALMSSICRLLPTSYVKQILSHALW